ncbi:hypothetical protein RYR42_002694 [Edwardsiella piscicida]|uniref:hypothetical protein n=1 Tax=Edwardsiella piscicida TaxID=1263550 RepID=UPI000907CAC1|nr:hypothetical protein [Edwardsiella piscicida]
MFCGKPATLLCDGLIGFDADEDANGVIENCRGMFTCDAPMCRACATWHGNIFFSGKAGGMDTKDYCPLCEEIYRAAGHIRIAPHRQDSAIPEPCLTGEQADIIRKAHWNSHLNEYRRRLSVLHGGGSNVSRFDR